MKMTFSALLMCLISASAFAANYQVPNGSYKGKGVWKDNHGVSGTFTMDINLFQDQNGLHDAFTARFSDGRQYQGQADIVYGADSNYVYNVNLGGQTVAIGQGVSTPTTYQISKLMLNQTEFITEFADFSKPGVWMRFGTLTDPSNGRSTQYEIKEIRK